MSLRFMRPIWRGGMVVALLAWAASCARGDAAENAGPGAAATMKMPVDVITLADVAIQDSSEYLAQLVSRTQVAIFPQVSGVVTSIFVKPGQVVREGAPLLQIDPRRESANLSNQLAARAQREANLALAKRNASRSAALFHEGLVSRQQLEQDQSQATVAEAEVNSQEAAIGAQSAQLGYYRISAPFDGAVGDIPVKVGDYVGPQTKLTSVDDNKTLEAYVDVPAESLRLLGDDSRVVLLDDDRSTNTSLAEAPISFVAQEANPQTQAVLVKAKFPNEGSFARPRSSARGSCGRRTPASASPRSRSRGRAASTSPSSRSPGAGGTVAHQVPVTLGELDNSTYAIVSGLKAGDQVIVSQIQKLRDGAPVETSPAKPAGAGSASVAAEH